MRLRGKRWKRGFDYKDTDWPRGPLSESVFWGKEVAG